MLGAYQQELHLYEGGNIDPRQFFRIRNLTRRIQRLQPKLPAELRSQFHVLQMDEAPKIPAGRHCTAPVTCEFFAHCNPPLPDDHILKLPRIHAGEVAKLVALGIQSIHNIPKNYPLTARLRRACTSVQTGAPWFSPELSHELGDSDISVLLRRLRNREPGRTIVHANASLRPLAFSVVGACAASSGRRAGALRVSCHKCKRSPACSSLVPSVPRSAIAAASSSTTSSSNPSAFRRFASWLPEFAGRIEKIQVRLWDLLPIIRDHVYHPAFGGSYSLKSVLPALVPEMTYKGMAVADGQAAGLAWESLVRDRLSDDERRTVRAALLNYCRQDTLGLVKIVASLGSISA